MEETVSMPKLGFDMAEGTLVRWVKKVGETISKGDVLAEIETDKATVEVESSVSGVLRRLLVDEAPLDRLGLHARMLTVTHPATASAMTFEAPYPPDFAGLWVRG